MLDVQCFKLLNYDAIQYDETSTEENDRLVNFVLKSTERDSEGRLIMPLMWNGKVSHLLGTNKNLARQVLSSNFKKLSKNPEYLSLMDNNIKELEMEGVIEKINDLDNYLEENLAHSFLPHMGVFRPDRETTKCRMVFLSNLCERDPSKQKNLFPQSS